MRSIRIAKSKPDIGTTDPLNLVYTTKNKNWIYAYPFGNLHALSTHHNNNAQVQTVDAVRVSLTFYRTSYTNFTEETIYWNVLFVMSWCWFLLAPSLAPLFANVTIFYFMDLKGIFLLGGVRGGLAAKTSWMVLRSATTAAAACTRLRLGVVK